VPNYPKFPVVTKTLAGEHIDRHARRLGLVVDGQVPADNNRELTDAELMLASPVVYGFSLSDKQWRESSLGSRLIRTCHAVQCHDR